MSDLTRIERRRAAHESRKVPDDGAFTAAEYAAKFGLCRSVACADCAAMVESGVWEAVTTMRRRKTGVLARVPGYRIARNKKGD